MRRRLMFVETKRLVACLVSQMQASSTQHADGASGHLPLQGRWHAAAQSNEPHGLSQPAHSMRVSHAVCTLRLQQRPPAVHCCLVQTLGQNEALLKHATQTRTSMPAAAAAVVIMGTPGGPTRAVPQNYVKN